MLLKHSLGFFFLFLAIKASCWEFDWFAVFLFHTMQNFMDEVDLNS